MSRPTSRYFAAVVRKLLAERKREDIVVDTLFQEQLKGELMARARGEEVVRAVKSAEARTPVAVYAQQAEPVRFAENMQSVDEMALKEEENWESLPQGLPEVDELIEEVRDEGLSGGFGWSALFSRFRYIFAAVPLVFVFGLMAAAFLQLPANVVPPSDGGKVAEGEIGTAAPRHSGASSTATLEALPVSDEPTVAAGIADESAVQNAAQTSDAGNGANAVNLSTDLTLDASVPAEEDVGALKTVEGTVLGVTEEQNADALMESRLGGTEPLEKGSFEDKGKWTRSYNIKTFPGELALPKAIRDKKSFKKQPRRSYHIDRAFMVRPGFGADFILEVQYKDGTQETLEFFQEDQDSYHFP